MRTITSPQGQPEISQPTVPEFPDRLVPFEIVCKDPNCRATLLVDHDDDVVYDAPYVGYGNDLSFRLKVVCPHCDENLTLESYPGPGNPTSFDPTPRSNGNVPQRTRSRAYKRWEQAQTRTYWLWFFEQRDVRLWAASNRRAARKMAARLVQPWTVDDLRDAGMTDEELDLLDRHVDVKLICESWSRRLEGLVIHLRAQVRRHR